jgi:hypothetical protein
MVFASGFIGDFGNTLVDGHPIRNSDSILEIRGSHKTGLVSKLILTVDDEIFTNTIFIVMKKLILFFSIISASGLLMITIYNLIVDSKSWGADIPASIQTARNYYSQVDPRNFFAIIAPINQFLILLTIILFWKDSISLRLYFSISFLLYAIIAILTFVYFIPRDIIIFTSAIEGHTEQIKTALSQWRTMNWLRSLLGLAGILFTFKGLDTFYKNYKSRKI